MGKRISGMRRPRIMQPLLRRSCFSSKGSRRDQIPNDHPSGSSHRRESRDSASLGRGRRDPEHSHCTWCLARPRSSRASEVRMDGKRGSPPLKTDRSVTGGANESSQLMYDRNIDGDGAVNAPHASPYGLKEASGRALEWQRDRRAMGDTNQTGSGRPNDHQALVAHDAGDAAAFCWAARAAESRTPSQAPSRRVRRIGPIRQGITRRASRSATTVRHAASTTKRSSTGSSDDSGGDLPESQVVPAAVMGVAS